MSKQSIRYILIVAVAMGGMAGCTKERETKEVLKYQVEDKSMIPEDVDYIYLPSVISSPRSNGATRPQWQGEAKLVRFQFTDKELRIYEVERDSRYQDNVNNRKPVLAIPVEHKDFKCVEDNYGDCTNSEKENDEVSWDKKHFFTPKFDEVDYQEVNFLPIEITNLFGNCYDELGSQFVSYKIEKANINFEVEKTFRTNIQCAGSLESLSDLTFSVRYHYSFARLDSLATPNYQAFQYSRAEETTFGYFTTEQRKLDVDNGDTEGSLTYMLNRWNPTRTVVYHMNAAFDKPENKVLKEATRISFDAVNDALKKSGSKMRLELRDPQDGVESGDLRHNMVVMVEDPQSSGIIGYGPSVASPVTGEIINARVVMYLGSIKTFLKWTYDEVIEQKLEEALEEMNKITATEETKVLESEMRQTQGSTVRIAPMRIQSQSHVAQLMSQVKAPGKKVSRNNKDLIDRKLSEKKMKARVSERMDLTRLTGDMRQRMEVLSKFNAYPGELFNFHDAIEANIDEFLKETEMKPWLQLTQAQKERVIDVLLPYVWVPTLIHEIGHNLGLRHNFAGSEDGANFYTDEELAEMGVHHKPKYSSVMDYAYRATNELRTMGKYDIAALRFGYAEKVELADGQVIDLAQYRESEGLELKFYDFCTDEHVSANPTCNRFDEGTNLLEITENFIENYERRYGRSNHRNGRRNFSEFQDLNQLAFLQNMMMEMRLSFERMETIKNRFGLPYDDIFWDLIPFLSELKSASLLGGAFMMDILKTPDVMCAVSRVSKPTSIIAIVPLRDISTEAVSCLDADNVQLNPAYMIVAEGGKSFQSRKDPHSDNPWVDQIDVRGIYLDKMLAAKYLFARELGSKLNDEATENYLDLAELRQPIIETVNQILKDEVSNVVPMRTIFGGVANIGFSYGMAGQSEILKPMSTAVRLLLKLPNHNTSFHHELLQVVARELPSAAHDDSVKDFTDSISVRSQLPQNGIDPKEFIQLSNGSERFFALQENAVAVEMIRNVEAIRLLSGLDPDKLIEAIANAQVKGQGEEGEEPQEPSAEEKAVAQLGADLVMKFLLGELKAESYYLSTLRAMSKTTERGAEERGNLSDLLDELGREISE